MSKRRFTFWALSLTFIIELATAFARFGLDLQSTRDTATTVGVLTNGVRIHHGYLGILLIIWAARRHRSPNQGPLTHHHGYLFGFALFASDLIHHFLVLWPLEGHHHFDLFY